MNHKFGRWAWGPVNYGCAVCKVCGGMYDVVHPEGCSGPSTGVSGGLKNSIGGDIIG